MVSFTPDSIQFNSNRKVPNAAYQKIGTNGPCVYSSTIGTVLFETTISAVLAPLKEWFHSETVLIFYFIYLTLFTHSIHSAILVTT